MYLIATWTVWLLTLVFLQSDALEVTITEITTNSVSLEWAANSSGVIVALDRHETFATSNRTINIPYLENSVTYTLSVTTQDFTESKVFTFTTAKCPDGWKGWKNSCFWASQNRRKGWQEAAKACAQTPTAHLADPRSEEENLFLAKVIPDDGVLYWIGVNDRESEGNFSYTDGSPVLWRNVTSDSNLSNCIRMDAGQFEGKSPGWEAFDCAGKRDYICQYHVQPSPKSQLIDVYTTSARSSWNNSPSIFGSDFNAFEFNLTSDSGASEVSSLDKDRRTNWISGLSSGQLYHLTVYTVHEIGDGSRAVGGIFPATPFVTRPSRPEMPHVATVRPTYAILSWDPPRAESLFDSYRITYKAAFPNSDHPLDKPLNSSEFNYDGVIVVDGNVTEVTLRDLEPYLEYGFTVESVSNHVTLNGNLSSSSYLAATSTMTLLGPPRNLHVVESSLDETSFRVSWKQAIGKVDGYTITVVRKLDNQTTHTPSTNKTFFDVTGLSPGHTYEVMVDSVRKGEISEMIQLTQTTRPVPIQQRQIVTTTPGNTSVEVVLLRTVSPDAIYDGFNLTFSATETTEKIHWRIPVADSLTTTATDEVTGLAPGRTYRLTVYTTSGDVRSFPVMAENLIETKPASPSPLRYTSRTERTIHLEWDPVPGDMDGFLVTCKGAKERPCSPEMAQVDRHRHEMKFSELTPGAEYNFTLSVERGRVKSRTMSLAVRTKPNSPLVNVAAASLHRNTTSLTLTWLKPPDLCDAFRVVYTPKTEGVNLTSYAAAGDLIAESGEPAGTVVTKDLQELTPGLTYDVSVTSLSGGVGSSPLNFVRATPPNPVEELRSEEIDETWLQVSWDPGYGGFVTFQVTWWDVSTLEPVELGSQNVSQTLHVITSLQPATLHMVTVTTYSADDVSPAESVMVQTRPLRPRDLSVEIINETSVDVSWAEPVLRNDDDFTLRVFQLLDGSETMVESVVWAPPTHGTFDDLTPGARYRLVIETLFNETRSHPVEQEFTTFPTTPPTVTVTTVTSTAINITWERPGGLVGGYEVEWRPRHGHVSVNGEAAAFVGLTPGVTYHIEVFTLSGDGTVRSQRPAETSPATDESEPSAPEELVLTSEQASSITASWKPPRHPNGRLLNYTIELWQLFPHPNEEFRVVSVGAEHTEHVLGGVEDGAVYYVKVSASNSAGRGAFTDLGRVKVRESRPGPVSELKAVAANSSSIFVQWNYPDSPNGDITRYQLIVSDPQGEVLARVNFYPKKNVNPFNCIFDTASREAISRLLFRHAAAGDVIPQSRSQDSDVAVTSPSSGSGQDQSDISKDFQQLSEVQQSVNTSTVAVDVAVTSHVHSSGSLPQETVDVSDEEVESGEPPDGQGRNLLDEYEVRKRRSVGDETVEGTFEQLCPVHRVVTGLEPYTLYDVTVRVWSAVGEGEPATTNVTTRQEPPEGPPTNIHTSSGGSRTLTLSWSPPDKPNGVPWYDVSLLTNPANGSYDTRTNDTSLQFHDLEPFTIYAVRMVASTVEGTGPASEYNYFSTLEGEPEQVGNITLEADGPRSMQFTWTPPLTPHGIIQGYVFELRDHSTGENETTSIDVEADPLLVFREMHTEPANFDTSTVGPIIMNFSRAAINHRIDGDLKPFNTYTAAVAARTIAGRGYPRSVTFRTAEAAPDTPPVDLAYTNVTSTSVNITWGPPLVPNGVITGYTVYISHDKMRTEFVTESYAVVENLMKYTAYEAFVGAHTAAGEGDSSFKIQIHTDEDVPDDPPTNMTYRNISSTVIHLSWFPPNTPNGIILFYTVYYTNSSGTHSATSTEASLFLEHLQTYGQYNVSISSNTSKGESLVRSDPINVCTMEGQPATPPYNLAYVDVTSRIVRMTWMAPVVPNGIIQFYNVTVTPFNNPGKQNNFSFATEDDKPEARIDGLLPYSSYLVSVRANTKYGDGEKESDKILIITLEDVPGTPPSLAYDGITSTSVDFTFQPPQVPNGVVLSYTLRYYPLSNVSAIKTEVLESDRSSIRVDNLAMYTSYNFTLTASTSAGEGPADYAVVRTDEDEPSSPPYGISYHQINSTAITLEWKPPVKPNGIITKYEVFYMDGLTGEEVQENSVAPRVTLTDLRKFAKYVVEIMAYTRVGHGNQRSKIEEFETLQDDPDSPPRDVVAEPHSSTSLSVAWKPPERPNGRIQFYTVYYTEVGGSADLKNVTGAEETTLNNLRKWTEYDVMVTASTALGDGGQYSATVRTRTAEDVPDAPARDIHPVALSSTSVKVTWSEPATLAGVTRYRVTLQNAGQITESPLLAPDVRDHVIGGLEEYSTYNVTVTVATTKGELESEAVQVDTHEDVPSDFPDDLRVAVVMGNSSAARVLFRTPRDPNGKLTLYTIQHRLADSQDIVNVNVSTSDLPQLLTPKESYSWPVMGLLGGRSYTFRIRAATAKGPGPWSLWTQPTTLPISAAPVPPFRPSAVTAVSETGRETVVLTSTTITVKNPCVFSDVNGPLASISVIVAQDGSDLNKEPTDWYEAMTIDPVPPYKVIFSNSPAEDCRQVTRININESQGQKRRRRRSVESGEGKNFVVGADKSCEEGDNKPFCNGPLKTNTDYRVKYRAETTNGAITDTEYSEVIRTDPSFLEAHFILIVSVASAVGAVLIILIISVIIIRRRQRSRSKRTDSDFVSMSGSSPRKGVPIEESLDEFKGPITESSAHSNMAFVLEPSRDDKVSEVAVSRPVGKPELAAHITRLSLHKNKGFSGEFDDIRGLPVAGTTMAADKHFNRAKNRHAKLVPFDHSRVKLEAIPAIEGSDYINASYVPGPQSAEQFIATQTPLEHTRKDFWRMVWETGTGTIVMLCSSSEEGKKKSVDYWPSKQTEYYGNLAVQMTHEDKQLDWTIRQFSITMRDKVRHLTQFQLMTWPVHEQSDSAQTVLRFVQTVRANRKPKSTPIVVMCTSGSGRSGVFVCLDRMLENLASKSQVDVFGNVAALRRYRPYMVQTLSEFILIHRCIWEASNQKVIGEDQVGRPPTGDGLEETVF